MQMSRPPSVGPVVVVHDFASYELSEEDDEGIIVVINWRLNR